jgi:hypothetical protein
MHHGSCPGLRQDIRHEARMAGTINQAIEMIGRYQITTIAGWTVPPVTRVRRLLTFRGEIGIEGTALLALQAADIVRHIVFEAHGCRMCAVNPRGKALIVLLNHGILSGTSVRLDKDTKERGSSGKFVGWQCILTPSPPGEGRGEGALIKAARICSSTC